MNAKKAPAGRVDPALTATEKDIGMKLNLNNLLQAVVILVVLGGLKVGWQLNQTVTRLTTIITRIEPLVDTAVNKSTEMEVRLGAVEKLADDVDERVYDLETGG
jgi:hypothetical protein